MSLEKFIYATENIYETFLKVTLTDHKDRTKMAVIREN